MSEDEKREKHRVYCREYYRKNRERLLQASREHWRENRDELLPKQRERSRRRYRDNREREYARIQAYRKTEKGQKMAREATKKWCKSPRGRELGRENDRRYYKTPNGRAKRINNALARKKLVEGQTPKWASAEAIHETYMRCPPGLTVDHIVPLKGESVCGLHVEYNLTFLSEVANKSKNNKFDDSAYQIWRQDPTGTIFLGDRVVPIGGTVSANPTLTVSVSEGTKIELTDVIGESTKCQKK